MVKLYTGGQGLLSGCCAIVEGRGKEGQEDKEKKEYDDGDGEKAVS